MSLVRVFAAAVAICITQSASAAVIQMNLTSRPYETDPMVATLTSLGHTVVGSYSTSVDLIMSVSGGSVYKNGAVPYIQIGDWGSDPIANSWRGISYGTDVTVALGGDTHSILSYLDDIWTTRGFHKYFQHSDYIGYATSGTGLMSIAAGGYGYDNPFAVNGDNIYIGWGIYGADANQNDLQLLSNSINYLLGNQMVNLSAPEVGAAPVPLPAAGWMLLAGLGGLAAARRKARSV